MNGAKTELLILTSKNHQPKVHVDHIQVADSNISTSSSVRNLGVIFDSAMTMDSQVKRICQRVYAQIRNVWSIRKVLSDKAAAVIVHALITSRLDSGNSLLSGITQYHLKKLQHAQNAAARILSRGRKFDHITPTLIALHWLPVKQRIEYKIILLTWKAMHGSAPVYISDLLNPYNPRVHLRSAGKYLLERPRTHSLLGDRSFAVSAPRLWNSLPQHLRSCDVLSTFKSQLKTYLFHIAYNHN